MGRGTSEGRFLIEVDGIAAVRATEVTGLRLEHTPFSLYVGNESMPFKGRGHADVNDVTIRMAHALNPQGEQFFLWMRLFLRGVPTAAGGTELERKTLRFVVLNEAGRVPVAVYEATRGIPRSFEVDGHTAGGNNASFFRVVMAFEDFVEL
jgi:hypothetical protein